MNSATLERARELYASGMKLSEVAKVVGFSESHLCRSLRAAGWRPRVKGWADRVTDDQLNEIERLGNRNLTAPEIAREVGLHRNTVARYMAELRLERQPYGHQTTAPGRRLFLYGPGDEPREKWCSRCKTYKALNEFHKSKRLRHGVGSFCKQCSCDVTRAIRARKKSNSSPPV